MNSQSQTLTPQRLAIMDALFGVSSNLVNGKPVPKTTTFSEPELLAWQRIQSEKQRNASK